MVKSDEKVVIQIQKGDFEEFREIVRRYEEKLYIFAFRILGDRDMAEDAVQESFIKAYRNINSFDAKMKFSSWIYRIVHNESINLYHKHKNIVPIEPFQETLASNENESTVHKSLDNKKNRSTLEKALKGIPIKYREVIVLRYFEDRSYDEISEILRIPVNTVGTFVARGKSELKKYFKGMDIEELL